MYIDNPDCRVAIGSRCKLIGPFVERTKYTAGLNMCSRARYARL